MITINGKKFSVYSLDTLKTVIQRISYNFKTLPKYLVFENKLENIESLNNTTIIDLLECMKISEDFEIFITKYRETIEVYGLNIQEDIINVYIAVNNIINSQPDISTYLFFISSQFKSSTPLEDIWEQRHPIRETLNNLIKKNEKKVKSFIDSAKRLEKTLPLTSTEFEPISIEFDFSFPIVNRSIFEIFNMMILNPYAPFANINNTYKILKDFTPNNDWEIYLEDQIILKVLQNKVSNKSLVLSYTDVIVSIEDNNLVFSTSITIEPSHIDRDTLIERILSTLQLGPPEDINITDTNIQGVFYIPKHTFNIYIFSDLVMNNPIFNTLMSIRETEKPTKSKNSIYVYFYNDIIGYVTFTITYKISQKNDPVLKGKDIVNDFPFGSKFIRVKASCESTQSMEMFKNIFLKLLHIYDNEYDSLVSIYKDFIPTFVVDSSDEIIPDKNALRLKDIAPEIFVTGYPVTCGYQPTIIEDNQVEDAIREGKIVMKYPIEGDIPGVMSRNYICNHTKDIYPGLRDNKLSNNDIIPYLPCCYSVNQEEKEGSFYRNYYFGDEVKSNLYTGQQAIIKTNKFVPKDKYGLINQKIINYLTTFSDTEEYMYVRKGVHDTKNTFLDCVLEGLYDTSGILKFVTKDERKQKLEQIRNSFMEEKFINCCKQEMYDFTNEEISNMIGDTKQYFNPRYFIGMLETYYDCNIYVFTPQDIILPRHKQYYYKFNNSKKRTILIYEHEGSKSDHSEYPRCELIVKWKIDSDDSDDVEYYYNASNPISKHIEEIMKRYRFTYTFNSIFPQYTEFPINKEDITILGQTIDTYGKCRKVNISYNGINYSLNITPIKPLITISDDTEYRVSISEYTQLQAYLGLTPISQNRYNQQTTDIISTLGNVGITILINDTEILPDVKVNNSKIYSNNNTSILSQYKSLKKYTKYITEYMFWIFSSYLYNNSIETIDENVIDRFVNEYILINPDFKYGKVDKYFSSKSALLSNGKIVVYNIEILKRLIYVLRLNIFNRRNVIIEYRNNKILNSYYEDISDYDQHQSQVILEGEDVIYNWIKEQIYRYTIYDTVQHTENTYFFKNSKISEDLFITKRYDTVGQALQVAYNWCKCKSFKPYRDKVSPQFILYNFISNTKITKYRVKGTTKLPKDRELKIIGYRTTEDEIYYLPLMKF